MKKFASIASGEVYSLLKSFAKKYIKKRKWESFFDNTVDFFTNSKNMDRVDIQFRTLFNRKSLKELSKIMVKNNGFTFKEKVEKELKSIISVFDASNEYKEKIINNIILCIVNHIKESNPEIYSQYLLDDVDDIVRENKDTLNCISKNVEKVLEINEFLEKNIREIRSFNDEKGQSLISDERSKKIENVKEKSQIDFNNDERPEIQFSNFIVKKQLLKQFKNTKTALLAMVYNKNITQLNEESYIDNVFSDFLKTILSNQQFNDEMFNELKVLICSKHSKYVSSIIESRLEIISKYWQGKDIRNELDKLAKKVQKRKKIPLWILNDIAIDLRNFTPFGIDNYGQKMLDSSPENVFFPILDRLSNNIKDTILKIQNDRKTYLFGSGFYDYVFNDVTMYYCTALLYGSLTHLLLFKKLLRDLVYVIYLSNHDQSLFNFIITLDILIQDEKQLSLMMDENSDINFKFIDYNLLLKRIEWIPALKEKNISKLLVMELYGYIINDDTFLELYNWFISFINECLINGRDFIEYYNYFKNSISKCYNRMDNDDLSNIIISALNSNYIIINDFGSTMFKYINIRNLNIQNQERLNALIFDYLSNGKCEKISFFKENVVLLFCKNCSVSYDNIEKEIESKYSNFYDDMYLIEMKDNSNIFYFKKINRYISLIEYMIKPKEAMNIDISEKPFLVIKNILKLKKYSFPDQNVIELMNLITEFLISKQSPREKCDCISLVLYIINNYKNILDLDDYKRLYEINKEKIIYFVHGPSPIDSTTYQSLMFFYELMIHCLNNNSNIVSATYGFFNMNTPDQINCLQGVIEIVDNKYLAYYEQYDLFVDFAVELCDLSKSSIVFLSVKLLCLLLNDKNGNRILECFSRMMDYSNPYARELIVRTLINNTEINSELSKEIIERSKCDINYNVRKITS